MYVSLFAFFSSGFWVTWLIDSFWILKWICFIFTFLECSFFRNLESVVLWSRPGHFVAQKSCSVCSSGQCSYQLRQLHSVRQSLDTESITTLIRAFVSSRVDYCCSLLIGSLRSVTDKLQRVLNAAASVITNSSKYDSGLSRTLHHDLHWLDVTEWIQFRVATTVYQCLHGMGPAYLAELCLPITAPASRRGGLWSATTSNLVISRCRLSTYSTCAFSIAGPVCWNAILDYLKSSDLSFNCFRQQLKHFYFVNIDTGHSTTLAN